MVDGVPKRGPEVQPHPGIAHRWRNPQNARVSRPNTISTDVPLGPMTTLGVGGPARYFADHSQFQHGFLSACSGYLTEFFLFQLFQLEISRSHFPSLKPYFDLCVCVFASDNSENENKI